MKVAVIGCGLAGLSIALKLIEAGCTVVCFDSAGVGGGASGVASGLMHPYPGEQSRRSWQASEALAASLQMLSQAEKEAGKVLANRNGIIRYLYNEDQRAIFHKHAAEYQDVEPIDENRVWIRSGVTVHCREYLDSLSRLIRGLGGVFITERVESLDSLEEYDAVVIAAGYGVAQLTPIPFRMLKGQVLTVRAPSPLKQSLIGKGYVAVGSSEDILHFGSTYERGFISDKPDRQVAISEIIGKVETFFPEAASCEVLECRAGVRVARIGHYYPVVRRIGPKQWLFTGMGSRGLLYHAYLADYLKQAIMGSDESLLPKNLS